MQTTVPIVRLLVGSCSMSPAMLFDAKFGVSMPFVFLTGDLIAPFEGNGPHVTLAAMELEMGCRLGSPKFPNPP